MVRRYVLSCSVMSDPMQFHQDPLCMGILQARILEWAAYPFSRETSWPRNRIRIPCIAGGFFTSWPVQEAHGDINQSKREKTQIRNISNGKEVKTITATEIKEDTNIQRGYYNQFNDNKIEKNEMDKAPPNKLSILSLKKEKKLTSYNKITELVVKSSPKNGTKSQEVFLSFMPNYTIQRRHISLVPKRLRNTVKWEHSPSHLWT